MSYIQIEQGIPDFNKAVISFWFRVPQKSLDELRADTEAENAKAGDNQWHTYPRLHRIMPLLTFGELFEGYKLGTQPGPDASYNENYWYTPGDSWVLMFTESRTYNTGAMLVNKAPQPINPSFIGIAYGGEKNAEEGGGYNYNLFINLQTRDRGDGASNVFGLGRFSQNDVNTGYPTGAALYAVPYESHWDQSLGCISRAPAPGNPHISHTTREDVTQMWMGQYGSDSFSSSLFDIEVMPDTWHHVLISFDLSKTTSTRGPVGIFDNNDCGADTFTHIDNSVSNLCQIWIAFDDENYTNGEAAEGHGLKGPNDWQSRFGLQAYFAGGGSSHSTGWGAMGQWTDATVNSGPAGSYTFPASPLPSSNYNFGIPAGANMVDHIRIVEMAEFQMWTGVTVDTGILSNRRAFIDDNGKPVNPTKAVATGPDDKDPKPPAERLLGKKPEILLHGSSNWKIGYNTGTLGIIIETIVDEDGTVTEKITKIPSGQFTPIARISKYKPEPALEETESA